MTHDDLIARLDYLSERANPGPYGVESYGSGTTYLKLGTWVGHYASERVPMMGGGRAEVVNSNVPSSWGNTCRKGPTAHLIAELVNAYRAGKLRVVDVDRRTSIEAADALEAQAEENRRLREALRPFASAWGIAQASGLTDMSRLGALARNETASVYFMRARAALSSTGEKV